MSTERRGASPDYPDFRHGSTAGPAGPPPEHTEHDIDRIAAEWSREDEVLRSHPLGPCGRACSAGMATRRSLQLLRALSSITDG
jgi:hypothetical protein